jgi:hypothetical protein
MSMQNAKSLENTLKQFYKERGREPTFEEFRKLMMGLKVPKDEQPQ